MPMVFASGTKVTLFFDGWTTNSTASYVLALASLFCLAVFNRFLGVLKFHIDLRWSELSYQRAQVLELGPLPGPRRHHASKDRVSPLPRHLNPNQQDLDQDLGTSSASPFLRDPSVPEPTSNRRSCLHGSAAFVVAVCSWCKHFIRNREKDGLCALLEALRALLGYALMLAVMTFNLGVLCAVVGGILVGEALLGRYTHTHAFPFWKADPCHD